MSSYQPAFLKRPPSNSSIRTQVSVGRHTLIPDPGYRSSCRLSCPRLRRPWRPYSLFFSLIRTTHGTMGQPSRWSTRYRTRRNPFYQWRTLTAIHFLPPSQFSLSADPSNWSVDKPEADDDLHRPDPRRDILNDSGSMFTLRGLANLGCLALLLLGIVTLLYAFSPFFFSAVFSF